MAKKRKNKIITDKLVPKNEEQKRLFDELIGHTIVDRYGQRMKIETLAHHILAVAKACSEYASVVGLGATGFMLGFLHDLGKCAATFQQYLLDNHVRVNHTVAAAYFLERVVGSQFTDAEGNCNYVGKMLACNVIGHHCGLPDCTMPRTIHSSRLNKEIQTLDSMLKDGETLYNEAMKNGGMHMVGKFAEDNDAFNFGDIFHTQFGVKVYPDDYHHIIRFLHSCLINADCLETEAVCDPQRSAKRADSINNMAKLIWIREKVLDCLAGLRNTDTDLGIWRNAVNKDCAKHGKGAKGVYLLAAHTGAGKTLSELLWALNQAITHKLARIIIAIPRTSITEQTVDILRKICDDDDHTTIVEHHSNLDLNSTTDVERMPMETWDAPIIVTTDVQLFESLRSSRNRKIRKLANIANSAIIIDEAHLLPLEWYRPIMHDIGVLVRHYQCSVLLATATLPNFDTLTDPFGRLLLSYGNKYTGIKCTRVISKETAALEPPNKVLYTYKRGIKFDTLAGQLAECKQAMCIVNTKEAAYDLYRKVADLRGVEDVFHLSTSMCGEHRSKVIATIKQRLASGKSVCIISTQLIEAGVDIDLPVVYRELAGMFSINQAGGRCNRERKQAHGNVYVFRISDKYYAVPETMEDEIATMNSLYIKHKEWSKNYAFTDADIQEYFDAYIDRRKSACTTKDAKEKLFDKTYIKQWCEMANVDGRSPLTGDFYFENMSCFYKFIPDDQADVIIQYNDQSRELVNMLHEGKGSLSDIRRLQRYTVGILKSKFDKINSKGFIKVLTDAKNPDLSDAKYIAYTLNNPSDYSNEFGLAELMFNLDNKTVV